MSFKAQPLPKVHLLSSFTNHLGTLIATEQHLKEFVGGVCELAFVAFGDLFF